MEENKESQGKFTIGDEKVCDEEDMTQESWLLLGTNYADC